jgi:NADPH2:quinone reductase
MNNAISHRIVVSKRGGPEVLRLVEGNIPEPGPGAVRVKVLAAGVSAFDVMVRSISFPGFPKLPFTPGCDIVGVIDAPGDGASDVEPGQMVGTTTGLHGGGYAEYFCLPAGDLVRVPEGVDPAEAVCVIANYITAHLAMHGTAHVKSGDRVLIQGAAGGVGTALLELGRLAGLEMYGTASKHNHELVSSMGAIPIDYHTEDFVERIRSLTGDGVDAVFDPIGGGRQLWRSYRALRKGGRLVFFGVAATKRRGWTVIPASVLMRLVLSLVPDGKHAPLMKDAGTTAEQDNTWYRQTQAELFDYLAAGKISPVVAERFPLSEARRAHELIEGGRYAGKVVLLAGD